MTMKSKAKAKIQNIAKIIVSNAVKGKQTNAVATTTLITTAIAILLSLLDTSNPLADVIIENKEVITGIAVSGAGALYGFGKK